MKETRQSMFADPGDQEVEKEGNQENEQGNLQGMADSRLQNTFPFLAMTVIMFTKVMDMLYVFMLLFPCFNS